MRRGTLVEGDLDLLRQPRVSIVGSRAAGEEAVRRAARLSRELSRAGVVVVSGLAEGIDTAPIARRSRRGEAPSRSSAMRSRPSTRRRTATSSSLSPRIISSSASFAKARRRSPDIFRPGTGRWRSSPRRRSSWMPRNAAELSRKHGKRFASGAVVPHAVAGRQAGARLAEARHAVRGRRPRFHRSAAVAPAAARRVRA